MHSTQGDNIIRIWGQKILDADEAERVPDSSVPGFLAGGEVARDGRELVRLPANGNKALVVEATLGVIKTLSGLSPGTPFDDAREALHDFIVRDLEVLND